MSENELARLVTLLEGQKISLSIAQVKEVIFCLKMVMKDLPVWQRIRLIRKMFW